MTIKNSKSNKFHRYNRQTQRQARKEATKVDREQAW